VGTHELNINTMIKFLKNLFKPKTNKIDKQNEVSFAKTISCRDILIEKFFRNLSLIEDFKLTYECYCDITETWDKPAFGDSNVTNRQYYITLKQISEVEYSESQCKAIKTAEIHENALEDYIISLDSQYDNLKVLCDELKTKEDNMLDSLKTLGK